MQPGERMRAIYEFQPVDHLPRTEFYIWAETFARWKAEGLPDDWEATNLFNFDPPGKFRSGLVLGWTNPPFFPLFEEKLIEVEGEYIIVQDAPGASAASSPADRESFMPMYLKHVGRLDGGLGRSEVATRPEPRRALEGDGRPAHGRARERRRGRRDG